MDGSRFAPPGAVVADVGEAPFRPAASVRWSIRVAWIAALFSAVSVLLVTMMSRAHVGMPVISTENVAYAAFAFAMALGIRRKSRTCAIAMLAYFLFSKYTKAQAGLAQSVAWALIFCGAYALGVIGTFRHHRLRKRAAEAAER